MPAAPVAPGTKRPRDNNSETEGGRGAPQPSASPHAAIIEIIHGITQSATEAYEKRCDEFAVACQDMDTLLSSPSFRQKALRFMTPRTDGAELDGPAEVGVVQLVANDGETLIFTSEAVASVNVPATLGQRVCMGDIVLFQRLTTNDEEGKCSAAAALDFLALDPSALLDATDWCHAASWNVVVVMKWVHKLLSCPPGLSQLTCIVDSFMGVANTSTPATDAWSRSLQLPLLLCQLKRVGDVEISKVQQVKRVILSLLRLYVAILGNAEAIMTLPRVVEELVYQFMESPLFVDGLTVVLPQMAAAVSESTWASVQQTMHDAMRMALRYVCREEVVLETRRQHELQQRAEAAVFTVLNRISAFWLTHTTAATTAVPQASGNSHAVVQLVEEIARTGVFRRVTQWMRHRERTVGAASLVDNAHMPPSLQDIYDLHGLQETTVKEMMAAMTQIYTPYLRQETLRFVEFAMLAAYAELYGPASRATAKLIESAANMSVDGVGHQQQKQLRIMEVMQPVIRQKLSDYTLEETQLHALFGMPLSIKLRVTGGRDALCPLRETTSTFACIVLLLNGKPFVFPVIVCDVVKDHGDDEDEGEDKFVVTATVYVLRDKDMLPSLVTAGAAASTTHDGLPEAWLCCSDRHKNSSNNEEDHISSQFPRFFPKGTSTLSYVLYILHLQTTRAQLRHNEQSGANGAARFKSGQSKGGAAQSGVLWWGASCSGGPSDFFVHSAPLAGEGEALQQSLSQLTDAASLTASQVECLHTLTSTGPGVRALLGTVGSGKTALMHAASLSRGRVQEALRRQHQPLWHALIKHSSQALATHVGELAVTEGIEDLFRAADGSTARDLPEDVTNAALGHIHEHVLLNEKLRQCQAPMLLRPRALNDVPPSHTLRVLQDDSVAQHYHSLESIMAQSHQRSLNAPLVSVLSASLQGLRRLGDCINVMRRSTEREDASEGRGRGGDEWRLYVKLLPWIMSKKERRDTVTEARRRGKTWEAYLSEDVWNVEAVVKGSSDIGAGEGTMWKNVEPAVSSFAAVTLPNASRSLCAYERSEAAGWMAVFGEKQRDLLYFLQQEIMDEVQHVFSIFLDVVRAVAATSQVSKVTVVTATGRMLLQGLSFMRVWQPRHLVVDDYDQLGDPLYVTLSAATSVVLSQQTESSMTHEQHVAFALLKSLQKELQGTPYSSTVVLAESLRFNSPEYHKAVQLCRNSSLAFYTVATRGVANANGGGIANNHTAGDGAGDGEQVTHSRGALTGFSSPSCLETWTHAVPLSAGLAADGVSTAFVCDRIRRIDPSLVVKVYCSCATDRAAILEGMPPATGVDSETNGAVSVSMLPFLPDVFVERDEECDIAVLCLSGFARRLRHVVGVERRQEWERLAATQSFVEHMEWWLWRVLAYARCGAVLVGSKEVFRFIEPLQRVERFVQHVREQRGYWLPPETQGTVLALSCPDHGNCRQLALLTYADYCGCQVRVIGVQKCRSLCLAPYDDCNNPSHACLHVCHMMCTEREGGEEGAAPSHSHCPFPCTKVQLCGHMCTRQCGEPCPPCEFVGLQELACGQRVVAGMSDTGPTLTLVRHFQEVRCGEAPQPCEAHVTLRCTRCGGKKPMLCREVTARGGMEHATMTELECAGCIALYNRIAKEAGVAEIAALATSAAPDGSATGDLPLQDLPEAARVKLQKLQSIATKKAQLMLQKEALETTQGRQTSEFYQQQEVYNRRRKQQEEEVLAHQKRVQESIHAWAKTLKEKYEVQITVNEEMETEVPLMISEAAAEEERQRSYLFV
ncbi:hypothetical protein DQ04_00121300 [Trypanosoma grayi]|uniref:hypothetical protein n=1 Tax=Trypanosoma grayi TaxID=71804 RepID=UPI0004F45299|nr:hypothetical protein DQ04_00121300 [Trypanosoma grayi]KEG15298.1 hypothetical protein DQ04_00121300 [Trypanosoma grayi]